MDVWPLLAEFDAGLPAEKQQSLKKQLAVYLNDLLLHDFPQLVQVLYRVDVPEKKIKTVLQQHPSTDAGELLADLLLQRQAEKKASRHRFQSPPDTSDEERW